MNILKLFVLIVVIASNISADLRAQEFGNKKSSQFGNTTPSWFKRYGEDHWTAINAIKLDGDSIVAAGSLGSSRGLTMFSGGEFARKNMYLMRLDAGGGIIWARPYSPKGVNRPTEAIDFDIDSDGNIIVVADVKPQRKNQSGLSDKKSVIIMKLGASGKELWFKEYPKSPTENAKKVVAATDGSYIALVQVEDDDGRKTRMIKVSNEGKYIGESLFDGGFFDIDEVDDGFVLVGYDKVLRLDSAGMAQGSWKMDGTQSEFFSNDRLMFMRENKKRGSRYMPTLTLASIRGEIIWQSEFDFKDEQLADFRAMVEVPSGFVVTGSYQKDFGVDSEVFIMMLDEIGEPTWIKELTGSKAGTIAADLLTHPEGGLLVAGAIDWDILISNKQKTLGVKSDAFIMRSGPSGESERLKNVPISSVEVIEKVMM